MTIDLMGYTDLNAFSRNETGNNNPYLSMQFNRRTEVNKRNRTTRRRKIRK